MALLLLLLMAVVCRSLVCLPHARVCAEAPKRSHERYPGDFRRRHHLFPRERRREGLEMAEQIADCWFLWCGLRCSQKWRVPSHRDRIVHHAQWSRTEARWSLAKTGRTVSLAAVDVITTVMTLMLLWVVVFFLCASCCPCAQSQSATTTSKGHNHNRTYTFINTRIDPIHRTTISATTTTSSID